MYSIKFNYNDEAAKYDYVVLPCEFIAEKMRQHGTYMPLMLSRITLQVFEAMLEKEGIREWTLDQHPNGDIEFSWKSPDAQTDQL